MNETNTEDSKPYVLMTDETVAFMSGKTSLTVVIPKPITIRGQFMRGDRFKAYLMSNGSIVLNKVIMKEI